MDQFRFTFAIFCEMIFLGIFCFTLLTNADGGEPTCYSRFDYDMKMFETVADMKQNQKVLTETVSKLKDHLEKFGSKVDLHQNTLVHIETSLIEQQQSVQKLEASLIEQQQSVQKLEASLIAEQVIVQRLDSSVALQEESINDLDNMIIARRSTYIRWGRSSCPGNGTTVIYKGTVGGSHYSHTGSGANHQCLPDDPTWGRYQDGTQGSKSYMYGAEYEPSSLHFDDLKDNEVPCAVCLTTRSTTIMIPARTSCYPGWTLEYEGNLVSEHYKHKKAQYQCVDKGAESAPGSDSGNQNGALFYAVEARCGSLHCPPYVEGRELACVVCSM